MSKSISIGETLESVIKLFKATYIDVLPIVLLLVICEYLIDWKFPTIIKKGVVIPSTPGTLIDLLVIMVFSCIVLNMVYVSHSNQKLDYIESVKRGALRFFPVLLSLIIITFPIGIAVGIAAAIGFAAGGAVTYIVMIAIGVGLFVYSLYLIYFYLLTALIVNRGLGPWNSLMKSRELVKDHWLTTFLLVLIIGIPIGVFQLVISKFIGEIGKEITHLLFFTVGSCLMVVLCDKLEQASDTKLVAQ